MSDPTELKTEEQAQAERYEQAMKNQKKYREIEIKGRIDFYLSNLRAEGIIK